MFFNLGCKVIKSERFFLGRGREKPSVTAPNITPGNKLFFHNNMPGGYDFAGLSFFDKYFILNVGEVLCGCILCVLFSGINGYNNTLKGIVIP